MAITSISAQSTQYVFSAVIAEADPTAGQVSFAFLGPYNSASQAADETPVAGTTYTTGSWGTPTSYPTTYPAQCLVGPSGAVTLTAGTYSVYVKISDSPETPIIWSGLLTVN